MHAFGDLSSSLFLQIIQDWYSKQKFQMFSVLVLSDGDI